MLRDVVIPRDYRRWRPAHAAVVGEVLIVDPRTRQGTWLGRSGTDHAPIERTMFGISAPELAGQIDWPPLDG